METDLESMKESGSRQKQEDTGSLPLGKKRIEWDEQPSMTDFQQDYTQSHPSYSNQKVR